MRRFRPILAVLTLLLALAACTEERSDGSGAIGSPGEGPGPASTAPDNS